MATQSDNTNTGVVATIVVVGTFSMISISALLTALVRSEEADVDAARPMHADLETIAVLDQQQLAALNAPPHWVDQKGGKLAIPIQRAVQLVIQDLRKDPAAASPPIPPGLVLPPQPPPEGTVPVPGATGSPAPASTAAPAPVVPGSPAPAPAAPAPATTSAAAPGAAPAVGAPPATGAAGGSAPTPVPEKH